MSSLVTVVFGMLIIGTASSISMKLMLLFESRGFMGILHQFAKPFTQSLFMFISMSLALPISKFWNPEKKKKVKMTLKQFIFLCFITSISLLGSTIITYGVIYINVSVVQMLRGSMTVFSALLSVFFLKKKIMGYEIFSISLNVFALIIVGIAGIFMPDSDKDYSLKTKIVASGFIVLSQLISAFQIILEQKVLQDINLPALDVVGWEGIIGIFEMLFIACPLAFIIPGSDPSPVGGSLENLWDSAIQFVHNKWLVVDTIVFLFAVLFYNIFGMLVTSMSNALNRTLLESVRTLFIWSTMLIFHVLGFSFGEVWSKWSWLQLFGFIILVIASLIYNKVVKIPIFKYERDYNESILYY